MTEVLKRLMITIRLPEETEFDKSDSDDDLLEVLDKILDLHLKAVSDAVTNELGCTIEIEGLP